MKLFVLHPNTFRDSFYVVASDIDEAKRLFEPYVIKAGGWKWYDDPIQVIEPGIVVQHENA